MIEMFNGVYLFWILISLGIFFTLYLTLKNKNEETKKRVLFLVLIFALVLHFAKALFPPYSTDINRLYRDSWFINICAANIALFPFFFLSNNKYAKDYMFYLGILGGGIAILYPMEPLAKSNQLGEMLDIIRFYIHHTILWAVPLLMVLFKMHTLSYRRLLAVPITFTAVMCFIVVNQILQSELGYILLRDDNFFDINYKNSSMIWGPTDELGGIVGPFCPKIFKTVPVGPHAGETKYWPIIWLICPMYILLVPITFLMCLAVDHEQVLDAIREDKQTCKEKLKQISSKH